MSTSCRNDLSQAAQPMASSSPRSILLAAIFLALGLALGATSAEARGRGKPKVVGVININTAGLEVLTLLPRIGRSTARRIIRHRKKSTFKHPRGLMRVRGVGRKTYRALAPLVTTSAPTKFDLVFKKRRRRR